MTPTEKIQQIQTILGVTSDGKFGPQSRAALESLISTPSTPMTINQVIASSFADPADVQAFRRCKASGKTDKECFAVGDNGVGCWGDDTTQNIPMVALPPEDWQQFGAAARGKKVRVTTNQREVIAELRDTMPHRANIKNGAGIDLNPAACKALGLTPPVMARASWSWA